MRKFNTKDSDYKGATEDILHRKVHIFSDDSEIHAVYYMGEEGQHVTTEKLLNITQRPDEYLYTPYLEFVDLNGFYK